MPSLPMMAGVDVESWRCEIEAQAIKMLDLQGTASTLASLLAFLRDGGSHPATEERSEDVPMLPGMLHPILSGGIASVLAQLALRAALALSIDLLEAGAVLYDGAGRVIHRNAALRKMLAADPEYAHLEQALLAASRGMAEVLHQDEGPKSPARQTLITTHSTYVLRCSHLTPELAGSATAILLLLEYSAEQLPSIKQLHDRYGLTCQEAHVALLLTERKRNREIAEALCISEHTARHHTERVLEKLGITHRTEVAGCLQK